MTSISIVKKLIKKQFPQYCNLEIGHIRYCGYDHSVYRLGDDLLIRLPNDVFSAGKMEMEWRFMKELNSYLTIDIPFPVEKGKPSKDYPHSFSIYKWISGITLNRITLEKVQLEKLAAEFATFLKQLQSIKVKGPPPGMHNFFNGEHLNVYDQNTKELIEKLKDRLDSKAALNLWDRACKVKWNRDPVWIHGDLASSENVLVEEGELKGVIDFRGAAKGDPAWDLVCAWTMFEGKSREIFIDAMDMDEDTWNRARTWAIWQAILKLTLIDNLQSEQEAKQFKIIEEVLAQ